MTSTDIDTRAHFDAISAAYDESLPPHVVEHYLEKRVAFVARHCPGGSALDVGCGTGLLAARLADAGYQVTGVDPSNGMLERMRARAPQVRAVIGSGASLPFSSASFDVVISVAVMHHIADADAVSRTLGEMVRVTRPGGHIMVWDHNPRNPYWGHLMARVPQDTGDERLVGEAELVGGLQAAGAEIVLARQLGLVPDFISPTLLPAAAAIERAAESTPLLRRLCAHNVIVAARRDERKRE